MSKTGMSARHRLRSRGQSTVSVSVGDDMWSESIVEEQQMCGDGSGCGRVTPAGEVDGLAGA
jgi:hypothetical protein